MNALVCRPHVHHEVGARVDRRMVAGTDDGGRLALLDDRRADERVARLQRVAIIDRARDMAVDEPGLALALDRARAAHAGKPVFGAAARRRTHDLKLPRHDLDWLGGGGPPQHPGTST